MTDKPVATKQKVLAVVVVASIAVFVIGLVIDRMPSEDTHDRYWMLFVAPSSIAFVVGTVALAMLARTLLARADRAG